MIETIFFFLLLITASAFFFLGKFVTGLLLLSAGLSGAAISFIGAGAPVMSLYWFDWYNKGYFRVIELACCALAVISARIGI